VSLTSQAAFEFGRREFTVSEMNGAIREALQRDFTNVWVQGEVSESKLAPSGHWYFSLKDAGGKLRCVCYRGAAFRLRVKPKDGLEVAARGYIDVYEPRGEYQFIVEAMQPRGFGALQIEFEEMKRKLEAEGLFAAERKRPLPRYPMRIGLVTSPSGAVIQDMLNVLTRRFPGLHIRLYPAQVQGAESVSQVCEGLRYFSESGWADVVIVGRGGGSLEDLWTFNTEFVARAMAASRVPVISAVGHETDFTIADFVADLRAATPSAAAELVVGTRRELLERLRNDEAKLERMMRYRLAQASERLHRVGVDRARLVIARRMARASQRLDEWDYRLRDALRTRLREAGRKQMALEARLRRMDLRLRFAEARRRLERATAQLGELMERRLQRGRSREESLRAQLGQLSPLAVLERGYAVVTSESGEVLTDAGRLQTGDALSVRLARGRLRARVASLTPNDSSELPS
jgi:exodeoxyribonuclease VII large subunit